MSEISVITGAIEDMAGRIDGISPGAGALHGQVQTHSTAAADTPAHDALSGLMGHWAAVLPHFGLAGDRLSAATTRYTGCFFFPIRTRRSFTATDCFLH